jgi:hypothetical protein
MLLIPAFAAVIVRAMRRFALTLSCWTLLVGSAAAQTNSSWLIVPSSSIPDSDWMEPAARAVRTALVDQGAEVWSLERAAATFEAEASAPPAMLSEPERERWMLLSAGAVDDLAEGNNKKALEKLNAAQDLSRAAIEELNRDPERARRVFDTCLYVVRAVLATESESRARAAARECRQLVPRAEPSPYMHPPAVTDLLARIDALQNRQTGALRLESTPSGCAARLNGVLLGETPVSIGNLFPGQYRVQVECDPRERGRVHFVTVGAGRTERRVDSRFDGAVESRPSLHLRYTNAADEREHGAADARRIARVVSAGGIVLLSMPGADTMQLERLASAGQESSGPAALARVSVGRSGPSKLDLTKAARTLRAGECTDFTSAKPAVLPCGRDESSAMAMTPTASDRPEGRRPRGQFIAGITLASAGIAGLATGYALLIPRSSAAEEWVVSVDGGAEGRSSQQKWFDLRGGIIASASVGAAALVTAMPLALPERNKTPWWAWMSGGAGLGLAAFSVAWGVTAEADPSGGCSTPTLDTTVTRACVKRGEQTSLALLTGLTAAPLITMPLVYLFRPSRVALQPRVEVGRSGAYLGLSGRF